MTKQEIKDLLKRHAYVEGEIRNCGEAMQCLVDDIEYERDLKAYISDGMPHTMNGYSDPTYTKAQRILDDFRTQIDDIERRQEGLFERRALVEKLLDILSPVEKQIIELRYFRKYKWCMVARTLKLTEKYCYRLSEKAIYRIVEWETQEEVS
jgi:DNA-directed RNA polymerase specialized sigma subunit